MGKIAKRFPELEAFHARITDKGLMAFVEAFDEASGGKLKYLNLRDCKVTDETVQKIMTQCCKTLETLYLTSCPLTSKILEQTVEFPHLTEIDLREVLNPSVGLSEFVEKCPKLTKIYVSRDDLVGPDQRAALRTLRPNLEITS
jgi:hypothetical protein